MLAPAPAWPTGLAGWLALPRRADAYLRDHFAFRQPLIAVANRLHWRLGAPLDGGAVLRGQDGRLFLRDDLLEVTGGLVHPRAADRYGDFVCELDRRLRARSIPLVFTLAPSPAAIYPEDLPDWVPRGRPSDYDLILARTPACGVNTVDLRPALIAATPGGSIYFHHDTHWTQKGALIAYDQLVQAMERPGWALSPGQLRWRRAPEDRDDLARMSGATGAPRAWMQQPDLAAETGGLTPQPLKGVVSQPGRAGFMDATGHPGPTVLVIGDSYSADFMAPYFAAHVGRFAWLHQDWCGFDWTVFDVVRPDYVVLMPVDRWGACRPGARPLHMPP